MSGDSMIVKVAKAIAVAEGNVNWMGHLDAARVAVKAMREPTVAMLMASSPDLPDWGTLVDDWQAMIDYVADEPIG
jgi:hypothetical protein